jgi:hypothetical protein
MYFHVRLDLFGHGMCDKKGQSLGVLHIPTLIFMKDLEGLLRLGSLHACKVYIVHDRHHNVNLLLMFSIHIVISFLHSIRKISKWVEMVGGHMQFQSMIKQHVGPL